MDNFDDEIRVVVCPLYLYNTINFNEAWFVFLYTDNGGEVNIYLNHHRNINPYQLLSKEADYGFTMPRALMVNLLQWIDDYSLDPYIIKDTQNKTVMMLENKDDDVLVKLGFNNEFYILDDIAITNLILFFETSLED